MVNVKISNVAIKGIGACVPKRTVSNWDYPFLSKNELEKYVSTIGVEERHCAIHDGTICTSDLCCEAAIKVIDNLEWDVNSINAVIFVSHTADFKLPSTACIIQNRLGITKSSMAFDVPLGCSGFVYGLGIISSIMQSGYIKRGLLLVGNTQSIYAAPKDQSTALLFGDAGAAIALEYEEFKDNSFEFGFYSDGSGYDALIVPDGGCRNPFSTESLQEYTDSNGTRTRLHEKMDGMEVFAFATRIVPKSIENLLSFFEIDRKKIDYLLLHQANYFLCEKIRKKLNFDEIKTPYNISKFGNTSGASIPLLMVTELRDELTEKSMSFVASGFGVGLSLGTVHFTTNQIVCPELLYL